MAHGHSTTSVGTPPFNPNAPDPRGGLLEKFAPGLLTGNSPAPGILQLVLGAIGNAGPSIAALGGPLGQASARAMLSSRQLGLQRAELMAKLRGLSERRQAMSRLEDLLTRTGTVDAVSPALSPSGALAAAEEPGIDPFVPQEVPFVQTPEGQRELQGVAARLAPQSLLENLLGTTELSGFEKKAQGVARLLGRPLTQEEVLGLADTGVKITNIPEDRKNEPIPISELKNLRDPKGNIPSVGTTYGEAQDRGIRVVSTEEGQRIFQADTVNAILDSVERLAFGTATEPGLFVGVKSGLAERAKATGSFAESLISQDDPRVSEYRALIQGNLASVVRFLGERGALTSADVERARQNFPTLLPADSEQVARRKLGNLREITAKGLRNLDSGNVQPPASPENENVSKRFRVTADGRLERVQ